MTSGNVDVRIGFDWNDYGKWITWSYTGTDCKYIKDQNEPTTNFAFRNYNDEATRRADVLRTFGQILGLELEHRHLSFDAGWTSRISQYWEGEITDIPWDELQEYVFTPLETTNLIQADEYDSNSIMIWPFSPKYATNTARDYNYELSAQDIEFIKQLYPKAEEEALSIRITVSPEDMDVSADWYNTRIYISVSNPDADLYIIENNSKKKINLENNGGASLYIYPYSFSKGLTVSPFNGGFDVILTSLSNLYEEIYTINIVGDFQDIVNISTMSSTSAMLELSDIRACTELEEIDLSNSKLENYAPKFAAEPIDLSKNTKLKRIRFDNYKFKDLDISQNKELISLREVNYYSTSPGMITNPEKFSISDNSKLEHFTIKFLSNTMTNLDLSQFTNLKSFTLYSEDIQQIKVPSGIQQFSMTCPKLENIDIPTDAEELFRIDFLCDTPQGHNQDLAFDFANQLPSRSSKERGIINNYYGPSGMNDWIREMCKSKNWAFQYEPF